MTNWVPDFIDLRKALTEFVTCDLTQGQAHIKPLHQYIALRLVIEGGFLPEEITPRPPLIADKNQLRFSEASGTQSEQTILGGLKSKNIDVVVCKDGVGPVVAISVKGTKGAFRNLVNRMEEAIGDCTNIHIMYPGLVYGFFQVIQGNRPGHPGLKSNDFALTEDGDVVGSIKRYHDVLTGLSGRRFVRDDFTRYEAVGFSLVEALGEDQGAVLPGFPPAGSPLQPQQFFDTLLNVYDLRFPYVAADMRKLRRCEWSPDSPAFSSIGGTDGWMDALGYLPRISGD
jgi:hypothetical protein